LKSDVRSTHVLSALENYSMNIVLHSTLQSHDSFGIESRHSLRLAIRHSLKSNRVLDLPITSRKSF